MSRRPQPLLNRAAITGVVSALTTVALALGYIDDDQARMLAAVVGGLISLLGPLVAALLARGEVTPVSDPAKVIDGVLVPLVPKPGLP